jgi:hypothetical protein
MEILRKEFDMRNKLFLALAGLVASSSMAFAQTVEPQNIDAIRLTRGIVWNVSIARPASLVLKFVGKNTLDLNSSSNRGYIDIGPKAAKLVAAPKNFTVPAPTVFGGAFTGSPDLFVYAGHNSTTGVRICVSNVGTLTAKGSVVSGNSGFVACDGTVGASDPIRILGKITYVVATPALTNNFTEILP